MVLSFTTQSSRCTKLRIKIKCHRTHTQRDTKLSLFPISFVVFCWVLLLATLYSQHSEKKSFSWTTVKVSNKIFLTSKFYTYPSHKQSNQVRASLMQHFNLLTNPVQQEQTKNAMSLYRLWVWPAFTMNLTAVTVVTESHSQLVAEPGCLMNISLTGILNQPMSRDGYLHKR